MAFEVSAFLRVQKIYSCGFIITAFNNVLKGITPSLLPDKILNLSVHHIIEKDLYDSGSIHPS